MTSTDLRVFGFLGRSTPNKTALVEKMVQIVDPDEASVTPLRKLARDLWGGADSNLKTLGRPFNCFRCLPDKVSIPGCQCCYSMFIDTCLLSAGASDEKRLMLDAFRRFIEENILAYHVAIDSWLNETLPQHVAWPKSVRYVSKHNALKIAEKIHSSLDKKNEVKEWLTACLLKTIKDNQRWHKRTELIDSFSRTTSQRARKSVLNRL